MLLTSASAGAAAPTFDSTFECSVATPCGSFTSWTPSSVAVDQRSGNVYVIDQANDAIDVFDANGTYQSQILGSSTDARSFSWGGGFDDIAVDNSGGANDGRVYADSTNAGLVFAFDASGGFLWQSSGVGGGFVAGVAVDPSGNPWIGDYSNGTQPLDPSTGAAVGSALLTGYINFAFDSLGDVAAILGGGGTHVFDPTGRELHADDTGISTFDVAVETATNSVYTIDAGGVTIWDSSGNIVAGTPFGPVNTSYSVTVNAANGKIYITEPSNSRVDIYDLQFSTLGVTVDGTGSGRVDADSGQIRGCTSAGGSNCSDRYIAGSTVTLTATADAGSSFTGWTNCDSPSGNICVESLTSDRTPTATFDAIPRHTLRVQLSGSGSGTVTSAPGGIDCGATCSTLFDEGTLILLTPTAAAGSTFTGWSGGGCSGTGPCQITLNADTDVTASFAQTPPTVSTGGASGVGETTATVGGTVNPNGGSVTDCHIDYGTSQSYGLVAACSPGPGAGASAVGVSASLSGLASGTTYHYRVVATNAGGTAAGSDATFTTSSPAAGCPQDLSKCPAPIASLVGFTAKTLTLKIKCTGQAGQTCSGKATFKAVIKVRVKHGRKTRVVKKTITVGTASYGVAAGSTSGVKLKLTSAAKAALKKGGLTAKCSNPKGTIRLPKTKVKKKKRH